MILWFLSQPYPGLTTLTSGGFTATDRQLSLGQESSNTVVKIADSMTCFLNQPALGYESQPNRKACPSAPRSCDGHTVFIQIRTEGEPHLRVQVLQLGKIPWGSVRKPGSLSCWNLTPHSCSDFCTGASCGCWGWAPLGGFRGARSQGQRAAGAFCPLGVPGGLFSALLWKTNHATYPLVDTQLLLFIFSPFIYNESQFSLYEKTVIPRVLMKRASASSVISSAQHMTEGIEIMLRLLRVVYRMDR